MKIIKQDPHGIIPCGWQSSQRFEVIGFCDPCGKGVLELMACIKWPNSPTNADGYTTTMQYIHVLKDFLQSTTSEEINKIIHSRPINNMSDKEIIDWIDKDPEERLESIRWRIITENCTIREAVEFLAKESE